MNINFNSIIKQILPFLFLGLSAYFISGLMYVYLPKSSPLVETKQEFGMKYKKYYITKNFEEKKDSIEKKITQPTAKKEYELISNITLQAIYASSKKGSGWIIISQNSSQKTHILSIGDKFKEYELVSVFKDYVIFLKQNKEYKLSISTIKNGPKYKNILEDEKKEDKDTSIEKVDDTYNIKRDLLNSYTKDFSKIWKDISIKEVKKHGKIDGFKINRISSKSIFKDLGLEKGDIIKGVNNITFKSYADAFKLYKKIDKIDNLKFIILRNNQIMEMEY
ncbi:MAG: hypothetical protein U9N59_15670, partial [Campylobacterota bacterium]|nr:hypothetical protein [Campylobacterota bacterium]